MTVKIDMKMPTSCTFCPYKKIIRTGFKERIFCKLTEIEFNSWDYSAKKFELCPLQEVK